MFHEPGARWCAEGLGILGQMLHRLLINISSRKSFRAKAHKILDRFPFPPQHIQPFFTAPQGHFHVENSSHSVILHCWLSSVCHVFRGRLMLLLCDNRWHCVNAFGRDKASWSSCLITAVWEYLPSLPSLLANVSRVYNVLSAARTRRFLQARLLGKERNHSSIKCVSRERSNSQ